MRQRFDAHGLEPLPDDRRGFLHHPVAKVAVFLKDLPQLHRVEFDDPAVGGGLDAGRCHVRGNQRGGGKYIARPDGADNHIPGFYLPGQLPRHRLVGFVVGHFDDHGRGAFYHQIQGVQLVPFLEKVGSGFYRFFISRFRQQNQLLFGQTGRKWIPADEFG